MKFYLLTRLPKRLFVFGTFLFVLQIAVSQTVVKGKIIDAGTGEVLVGATVVIKGTTTGAQTDYDGLFSFSTDTKPPFTLQISFIGFETIEQATAADTKYPLSIKLGNATKTIDVVEIKGQRISEKTKSAQFTVESMDKLAIKQTASVSFYEGMGTLKGVDATTASIGFTVINTRGFNSTSPVRSLQIIDGVDNQAPGLNFSLGNFLGSSELDVLKADLIVGASSAFYGPNAFNGVLSMETKNPFFLRGMAAQVKVGERNLNEVAFRYADSKKNKEGKDWFAFKLNGYFLKAHDWEADNYDPVTGTKTGLNSPGGYDAVNKYGDEREATYDYSLANKQQPWSNDVGLGQFHRTPYKEIDMVDYNTRNIKANAAFHFRLNPIAQENSPELILSSNFGSGTTVYQGDNRFSLKNILFFQNRLELRKRDKYFFRIFATNEDAGNTYDPYFTALLLEQKSKTTGTWGSDYSRYWEQKISPQIFGSGYPRLQILLDANGNPIIDPVTGAIKNSFDRDKAAAWLSNNQDKLAQWHQQARNYADTFQTKYPFFAPGTDRFLTEFNRITTTKSSKRDIESGGTGFYDKSALYHAHGEYHFQPKGLNDLTVGGNMRLYTPISQGTIFIDTGNRKITNFEYGVYTGIEKKFSQDKFKLNATIRMDKNQNFGYLFSPAASLVWKPDANNFIRFSFSSAIRNPTLNDQYLNLNVGRAILTGNIKGVDKLIRPDDFVTYIDSSFNPKFKKYFSVAAIRPEKVKSLELGYRTTLFNNTFVDMSYYFSFYNDFIGYQLGVKSDFDATTGIPQNIQGYRVASNAASSVTTQGYSIGVSHYFAKFYQISGNYSWNVLNTKTDDPIIPAFNTPENKFNIGFSGRNVEIGKLKNAGFNINYKWIQGFTFQGSPQFSGSIPTYDLLDAQVNYTFPKANTTLKVGASNVLNKKQYQVYGGPRIGRMAYISLVYDWVQK
jgi:iron complex outermembrane recepter protein